MLNLSKEQLEELISKYTYNEIAKMYGCSTKPIRTLCAKYGINREPTRIKVPPTKEELEFLISKRSFVEIGKTYGCSDNAIRKLARRYGIEWNKVKLGRIVAKDDLTGEEFEMDMNQYKAAKLHFKSRANQQEYQRLHGKLADLDEATYRRLLLTHSQRAIARMYDCSHTTLQKKFK